MKLTYGWGKGQNLKTTSGDITRPTSAKLREALMSILRDEITEGIFVDVFAGSGAMGLDALTRGAQGTIFIEKNHAAISVLKENILESKRRAKNNNIAIALAEIWALDAHSIVPRLETIKTNVSVIWADPPYSMTVTWLKSLNPFFDKFMAANTTFALECSKLDVTPILDLMQAADAASLTLFKEKNYGDTSLLIWKRE